ncbi:hypothetical protein PpBr36_01521 [Pyricularia pennisetigena]|uniref:hypothetical protein n=1 Tax=Pyricularia pennisetigena TaxID=1578925 RepID=UPI0011513A09|nr:hypothetical protein PpBr36_01521 [Pyricularia pennisetigena]TLS28689.1 hypothetical protein PpBr36_01521 [Pyricularia pennisetigena]
MTSLDVRDVLNIPQDGSAPRPSKKGRQSAPRTNLKGLAREVQSLGGDNPIPIVPETSVFKKRRQASRKPAARWELRQFRNSARDDASLILRHWCRKQDVSGGGNGDAPMEGTGQPPPPKDAIEDSAFAKFNVKVDVPQYNDDQYNSRLQSAEWTKDETDYLLELVRDFDLRWPLIWDRYDYKPPQAEGDTTNGTSSAVVSLTSTRSMEDLKARYYEVAAKMMAVQKPAQYMTNDEFQLYETMLKFDPVQETQRKKFAANCLTRTKEEAREEESLLLEVKRILARQERFNEERRELYNRLDYPPTSDTTDISSFKTSQGLSNLIQNIVTADKTKKRKSLMAPESAGGIATAAAAAAAAAAPTSAGTTSNAQPASATTEARRESTVATPAGNHRDSISAVEKPAPAEAPAKGSKKGSAQTERRKLNEHEEQVYGVSYHDRLSSGPTFRNERVNKLFSHKSMQQQQRITNVLNELDIPARLVMPTAAVTSQFEQLVQTVTQLVDLRKQIDKLDGEIKVEQARKTEREKAQGVAASQTDGATDVSKAPPPEGGDKTTAAPAKADGEKPPSTKADNAAGGEANGDNGKAAASTESESTTNGEKKSAGSGQATEEEVSTIKDEDVADKDKTTSTRPGSRGSRPGSRNKRSASVLSAGSDKGKRQKR